MAKIETYSPTQRIDPGQAPQLPYRHLEVPSLTSAARGEAFAARNLEGFGGAVQTAGADVTAYYQQKAAEADQAWVAKARAQTTLDWPQQEAQLQSGSVAQPAMGVGGAGVMPASKPKPLIEQTKATLDDYQKNVLAGAPSPKAAQAYQQWFAEFGAQAQNRAFAFDQHRQEVQKNADFQTALDSHTRLVGTDPSQFDAAWSAADHDFQGAAAWMPADKLAILRDDTRAKMEFQRARAFATNDPLGFQREVTPTQYDAASGTGKPYGGWVDNKNYSHLQPDQIAALTVQANSNVVSQHNAAIGAQNKAHEEWFYNQFMPQFLKGGSGGQADIWEARRSGQLTDYREIVKAQDALKERDGDNQKLAEAQTLLWTGHNWNPFVKADKEAFNLVYKDAGGADGLLGAPISPMAGQGGLDPQALSQQRLLAFVDHSATHGGIGIVPQDAVDEIRRGMYSQDKGEMTNALTLMDGLSRLHPQAMQQAFAKEEMQRLDQYQVLAPITKPDELVQAMNPNVDTQTAKLRDERGVVGKKLLDDEVAKGSDYLPTILDHFNPEPPGIQSWNPFLGRTSSPLSFDPRAEAAMRHDFMDTFVRLYGIGGNEVSAKAGAIAALDRKWQVTNVGSQPVIMANAPERSFNKVDKNYDWMERQAEDQVKATYPDAQEWTPVSLPQTEAAIGVRQTPSYGIYLQDKNGVPHFLSPPPDARPGWPFDEARARADAIAERMATRGSLIATPPGDEPSKLNRIIDAVKPPAGNVFPFKPTGGPLGSEQ